MTWRVTKGDCVEAMAAMPEASVDAIVCDPPYSLGFMSRPWDMQVDHTRWSVEALRVLKPGGHLLAFGGTRTYHRLACAIEDAGFEVRDCLAWLYGSGFPKSLDVSKAIDKAAGAEREVVGERTYAEGHVQRSNGTDLGRMNDDAWQPTDGRSMTAPATPDAERWDGWGTALKPAWESIVVATKPAANTERDIIDASLCLLGNRIASLSPANPAVSRSASSPAEHDAALLASARWTADERSSTRDALCAQMDTSRFESAISSSLSIVSSWRRILVDLCELTSMCTTETASSTTTALQTLKSSLSGLTPRSIIEDASRVGGSSFSALPAARAFSGVESRLTAIRELLAPAPATGESQEPSPLGGVRPNKEPIVMARKPLAGTVAQNCLEHGTGALNVDGCRIGSEGPPSNRFTDGAKPFGNGAGHPYETTEATSGRWPANVVLDEQAAAMLDEQTGEMRDGVAYEPNGKPMERSIYGATGTLGREVGYGGSGGASRFLYVAKASSAERNAGLDGFEGSDEFRTQGSGRVPLSKCPEHGASQPSGSLTYRCGCARVWDGREGRPQPRANVHPTVKPIELMRWLVRLVTPPGGTVLDPFAGSGTTGCAAVLEGLNFVGIEREAEYVAICRARIGWWEQHPEGLELVKALEADRSRRAVADSGQLGLLG